LLFANEDVLLFPKALLLLLFLLPNSPPVLDPKAAEPALLFTAEKIDPPAFPPTAALPKTEPVFLH
jgi:hypothetical protein